MHSTQTANSQVAGDFAITIKPASHGLGIINTAKPLNSTKLATPTPITKYDEYASTDSDSYSDDEIDDETDNEISYYGIKLDRKAATLNLRQFIPKDVSAVYDIIIEQWNAPTAAQEKFAAQKTDWTYMVNASKYIKAFQGVRCSKLQPAKNHGFPKGIPYPHRFVDENKPEGDVLVNDDGRCHGAMGPKGGVWAAPGKSKLRKVSLVKA